MVAQCCLCPVDRCTPRHTQPHTLHKVVTSEGIMCDLSTKKCLRFYFTSGYF